MQAMKLKLRQLPRILFAHGYRTASYRTSYCAQKDVYEICYMERGAVEETFPDGNSLLLTPPVLCCLGPYTQVSLRSGEEHEHFTVGFTAGGEAEICGGTEMLCLQRAVFEKQFFKDPASAGSLAHQPSEDIGAMTAFLPFMLPEDGSSGAIERLIKKIIRVRASTDFTRELQAVSLLVEMLHEVTQAALRLAVRETDGAVRYAGNVRCRQAVRFISENIEEPISVSDVARAAGVSTGYLSKLFRDTLGMGVIDYINRLKLNRVKELLSVRQVSIQDAAASVGIDDPNYLSRLFKKYNGITATEYRALRNHPEL